VSFSPHVRSVGAVFSAIALDYFTVDERPAEQLLSGVEFANLHSVAGVDRNTCQSQGVKILFEREDMFDVELVTEDCIEMIDK